MAVVVERLLSVSRPIVLVGYVEGLEHAVPMTLDEAAEARRDLIPWLCERDKAHMKIRAGEIMGYVD